MRVLGREMLFWEVLGLCLPNGIHLCRDLERETARTKLGCWTGLSN